MANDRMPDWRRMALDAEAVRDLPAALDYWQKAHAQAPEALDIVAHIADLASRLSQWPLAEKLYAHLIQRGQQSALIIKAYAETLREQSRFDEAVDLLKTLLQQNPSEPALWEVLGTIVMAQGDTATAQVFLDEAVRLSPEGLSARFERGCAHYEKGDLRAACEDINSCRPRFKDRLDQHSASIMLAYAHLAMGDVSEGWRHYQARHKAGTQHEIAYDIALERASASLANQKLFLTSEQGLGDEVMLASLMPDIQALSRRVGLAVEPRLVPLFQRSFPEATIIAHHTRTQDGRILRSFPDLNPSEWDGWGIIGDLLPQFRPDIAAFPSRPYLKADPQRVRHWQDWLSHTGKGPKVGLLWKSLKSDAQRERGYAPFAHYLSLIKEAGATFINLQYGDCDSERTQAQASDVPFFTPPDIDLKDDLDDVAALCTALDLVIAPPNATSNIAGACGTEVWMVTTPIYWPALGQEKSPWFARSRIFATHSLLDWSDAFTAIRNALMARIESVE